MVELITKKEMTEEDIKHRFITPTIEKEWDSDKILMEYCFSDGRIIVRGNQTARGIRKKAGYLLDRILTEIVVEG